MADRNKIIKYCEDYLKVCDFEDYCVNGLQLEGSSSVKKIISGVSISEQLIDRAIKEKADMIIVHHGIFKDNIPSPFCLKGYMRKRIKKLLVNNINLLGFHLPLDAHPVIGNNISLCKLLKVKNPKPFYVGFYGELEVAKDFNEFSKEVGHKLDSKIFKINAGPKKSKRIGIVSGGASPNFIDAFKLGVDTYICGDIRESVVRAIEEVGINFINAGHYNTEKLGIKNLGELLSRKFNVKVEFIDIPCEV
jgi:dinuclear metal center YbgI/SA1388 family protein